MTAVRLGAHLLTVVVPGRPFTANQVARQSWAATARMVKDWRTRAYWHARVVLAPAGSGKVIEPVEGPVVVAATSLHRTRRSLPDTGAVSPCLKAVIDGGLVDTGFLADDSAEYISEIRFRPPEVVGQDGLRVEVYAAESGL